MGSGDGGIHITLVSAPTHTNYIRITRVREGWGEPPNRAYNEATS